MSAMDEVLNSILGFSLLLNAIELDYLETEELLTGS